MKRLTRLDRKLQRAAYLLHDFRKWIRRMLSELSDGELIFLLLTATGTMIAWSVRFWEAVR